MRSFLRSAALALFISAMFFANAGGAAAQTFSGSFSSSDTWFRLDPACNPESNGRLYVEFSVYFNASGTYTFTATRAGGATVAVDLYSSEVLPWPSSCLDQLAYGTSGAGSASVQIHSGTVSTGFVTIAVSSGTTTDLGAFTLNVSGPAGVDGSCSGTGVLTTSSQAVPIGGGSYATTYTPPAGLACSGFATHSVPSWITGIPAGGGGMTTMNYTVASNPGGPRSAHIRIGENWLDVSQAGTCNYAVSPTTVSASGATSTLGVNVNVNSGCAWTATTTTPWITLTSATGNGNGVVWFDVAANTGAARSGTITVGGKTITVNQAAACTYSLSTSTLEVGAASSMQSVTVTSQSGCPLVPTGAPSWITPSATTTGSGTLELFVYGNTGPARQAALSFGATNLTVNQASGCVLGLPTTSTTAPASGGSTSFLVNRAVGCGFAATPSDAWLAATTTTSGVDVTVAPSSVPARTGTITVTSVDTGATSTFTVQQANGCVVMLAATGANATVDGGAGSVTVTTDAACTPVIDSSDAFLGGVSVSGGTISYDVEANTGVARSGTIVVSASGGPAATFTVMQPSGCTPVLPAAPVTLAPAGTASQTIAFTAGSGCTFTASVDQSFVTVLGTPTNGTVYVAVPVNTGAPRSALLTLTADDSGNQDVVSLEQASSVEPPVLLTYNAYGVATVGGTYTFEVQATGDALTYTYERDGTVVASGPTANLVLSPLTLEDSGVYTLTIANSRGSVEITLPTLTVSAPSSGGCAVGSAEGETTLGYVALALLMLVRRRRVG